MCHSCAQLYIYQFFSPFFNIHLLIYICRIHVRQGGDNNLILSLSRMINFQAYLPLSLPKLGISIKYLADIIIDTSVACAIGSSVNTTVVIEPSFEKLI